MLTDITEKRSILMKLLDTHKKKKPKLKSDMRRGGTIIIECSDFFFARVGSITYRGKHTSKADIQRFESLRVFII